MRKIPLIIKTSWLFFLAASALVLGSPLPNLEAIDQNGKPFRLHSLKGNYLLVSFVFTSCPMPKMCPLTMRLNKQTQALWKKEIGAPLHLLIVTLDPEGDSPEMLKKYGIKHGLEMEKTSLITGNPQALSDFGSLFNVAGWPSGNTTVHNLKTILVGPQLDELKQYKENEWTPEQVVKDAKAFIKK